MEKACRVSQDFQTATTICTFTAVGHPSDIINSPGVIIGTIPGKAMPTSLFAGIFRKGGGLCIEMAYKPRVTNLLGVVRSRSEWTTADGLEVLLRQAFDQSRL